MAKITTITNPLTGQPAQVDQLEHTAQEIDDAIARALPGGAIDKTLQNKLGGVESADHPGCYYRMVGSVVEWFNPPMALGVEYRTTERFLGKPVYVKAINFGALAIGLTEVAFLIGGEIPLRCYAAYTSAQATIPWIGSVPGAGGDQSLCSINGNNAWIWSTAAASSGIVFVGYYYKSTD